MTATVKQITRRFVANGRTLTISAKQTKQADGYMNVAVRYKGSKAAFGDRARLAGDEALRFVEVRAEQAIAAGWSEVIKEKKPRAAKQPKPVLFKGVPSLDELDRIDAALAERKPYAKPKAKAEAEAKPKAAKPRLAPAKAKK